MNRNEKELNNKKERKMLTKLKDNQAEELENTMLCARWLVLQFEDLHCGSIAKIFQRAVNDADAWIQTMVIQGKLPEEYAEPIKAKEAALIHNLLIKYASIDDPDLRKSVLDKMMSSTNKNAY